MAAAIASVAAVDPSEAISKLLTTTLSSFFKISDEKSVVDRKMKDKLEYAITPPIPEHALPIDSLDNLLAAVKAKFALFTVLQTTFDFTSDAGQFLLLCYHGKSKKQASAPADNEEEEEEKDVKSDRSSKRRRTDTGSADASAKRNDPIECLEKSRFTAEEKKLFAPLIKKGSRLQGANTPVAVQATPNKKGASTFQLEWFGYETVTHEQLKEFRLLAIRSLQKSGKKNVKVALSIDYKQKLWISNVTFD